MAFDQFVLQKAVYESVVVAFADQASPPGIFTQVPQDAPYPFVRIGLGQIRDSGTKDVGFVECDFVVSAFFRDVSSTQPVSDAMKRIRAALHDQPASLVMSGQAAILIRNRTQQVFPGSENGDDYLHGYQQYRTLIQEL